MLVNLYGNLKFIKAFQKDKDGKQKDEGVSFHMKPTGWFRNGLETYLSVCKLQIAITNYAGEFIFIINILDFSHSLILKIYHESTLSKRIPLEDVHLRIIQLYPKLVKKLPKPTKSKTEENYGDKGSDGDKQSTLQSKKSKSSEEDTKKNKKSSKTETTEIEEVQTNTQKTKKHKKPSKSDSKISDTVFEEDLGSEPIPSSSSKNSKTTGAAKEEIPEIISLENQPEKERIYDLYWSNGTDKFCILKGDDGEFQRAVKVCSFKSVSVAYII